MGQYNQGVVPIGGEFDLPSLPILGYSDSGLFSLNRGLGLSLAANIVYLQTLALWQVGPHALPSGILTALAGSPFATAAGPRDIAVDPSGKFLYNIVFNTNTIYAYTINPVTGAIVAVAGSPFATGAGPGSIAISPNGKFLYVTNNTAGSISAYTINQATGALTPVAGSPFATGAGPNRLTVTPNNGFLLVTNSTANTVSSYSINAATGALTAVAGSPFATGATPVGLTVNPAGTFCAVGNFGGNSVSVFSISATGVLTPVVNSPFASGTNPNQIISDPMGRFIYVACNGSNNVWVYTINGVTGALTPITSSPFVAGAGSYGLATDPAGEILVVTNFTAGTISTYLINDITGFLTPVAGSPFATGGASPGYVVIDPTGKFCYVVNAGGTILGYSTSTTVQLPLLEGTFDQSGSNQNRLNINGQVFLNGNPIVNILPATAGNAGKFLRVDMTGTTTLWDGVNTNVPLAFVANAAAGTVDDSGDYQFDLSGALTAQGNLTITLSVPADATKVIFDNATTGGFPVVVNGVFTIPPGKSTWYWNGATFERTSAGGFSTAQVTPLPAANAAITINHLCGAVPTNVFLEIVCLVADGGYSPGDVIQVISQTTGILLVWKNATQCGFTLAAASVINIPNKATGAFGAPVAANWAYRFSIQP